MEETREYYYLNRIELNVLFAASGVENWFGPMKSVVTNDDNSDTVNSLDDINHVIADLYRKEILEWSDGIATVAEPIARIMHILGNSDICIMKIKEDDPEDTSYIYPLGDLAAEVSVSRNDTDLLELSLVNVSDWIESLTSDEFFPDVFGDVPEILPSASDELYSSLETYDTHTGKMIHKLSSEDKGVYSVLFYEDRVHVCDRKVYEPIIYSWLKKEKSE